MTPISRTEFQKGITHQAVLIVKTVKHVRDNKDAVTYHNTEHGWTWAIGGVFWSASAYPTERKAKNDYKKWRAGK